MNKVLNDLAIYEASTSLESLLGVSMEATDSQIEREYEIYGEVSDREVLKSLSERIEYQEQWGLPTEHGNLRIRKTQIGDDITYTLTIKDKREGETIETETDVTEAAFMAMKAIVPEGLVKTRYVIPVEDSELKLEVDVFSGDRGTSSIVKIDLEVAEDQSVDQVKIPFKLENVRVIKPGRKSEEDLEFVRELFDKEYTIRNLRKSEEEGE